MPQLVILAGAATAIFITGRQDVWALVAFIGCAGCGMLLGRPARGFPWMFLLPACALLIFSAFALLPGEWFGQPQWRGMLASNSLIPLSESVTPQAHLTWFWIAILACAGCLGWFLVSCPLEGRALALFGHVTAAVIAVYAILAVGAHQGAWIYPFDGTAAFGFFPNKNHSATLLAVGAVLSFGLMYSEASKGQRFGAISAALCGAAPTAGLLFFSNSRAGFLILLAGSLIWLIGAPKSASRKTALIGALVAAVFLGLLFGAGSNPVRDRLEDLWQRTMVVETSDGLAELDFRQLIFRDTWRLVADYPVTGVGLGQFQYVFPHYRNESVRSARILHPESDWLMVASEMGWPAFAALLFLTGYYVYRNWQARVSPDGPIRWAFAAAIGAAILHGVIDVPWHRPALGWFLMVVALAAMPPIGRPLRRPGPMRVLCAICGVALVAFAAHIAYEFRKGYAAAPYQWDLLNARLTELGKERRQEEGEFVALETIQAFPLKHESYYWLASYLRAFLDTEKEVVEAMNAGRMVEPVLPSVALEQAAQWAELGSPREAEAWAEAVRRSMRVDRAAGDPGLRQTRGVVERALRSLQASAAGQLDFLTRLGDSASLRASWFRFASADAAEEWLRTTPEFSLWLDGLDPQERGQVLDRWITLPSAAGAVAYMEARNAPAPGAYWRQLAEYYAKAGDKARAVGMVAEAEGLPLDGPLTSGEFGGQLAGLEAQGNNVSVRRLLKEASEGGTPDPDKLRVAMSWYAAAGDWEMAWRAASRLATATKNRQ